MTPVLHRVVARCSSGTPSDIPPHSEPELGTDPELELEPEPGARSAEGYAGGAFARTQPPQHSRP